MDNNINNYGVNNQGYTPVPEQTWSEPVYEPVSGEVSGYSPNHYGNIYAPAYNPNTYDPDYERKQKKAERREKRRKRGLGFVKAVCIILVSVLLSGTACYFIAGYVVKSNLPEPVNTVVLGGNTEKSEPAEKPDAAEPVVSGDVLTSEQIYTIAKEQVVGVTTEVTTTNYFGQQTSSALSGSGFVISEDGYIMTNYHVIEYGVLYGGDVTVMMNNGDKYKAQIVAHHADNDVALLKIEAKGLSAIKYNYDLAVGQTIYAIGNPLGELAYTMTSGIVSALDRVISTSDNTGASKSINMFQIDAAVNSGNSGGPVYNSYGEVVGMVTAKYSSSGIEGLGFAIPIEDALNIASQLLEKGYVSGAQMGVKVLSVDQVYSAFAIEYYGYPDGVCIMEIYSGSAAEKAGIIIGDIITEINGVRVTTTEELKTVMKKYAPGDSATIKLYRIGNTLDTGDYVEVNIVFEETSEQTNSSAQQNQSNYPYQQEQGGYPAVPGYPFG